MFQPVQPVHPRHVEIQQHQIIAGIVLQRADRLGQVFCAGGLDIALGFQKHHQRVAQQVVIVGN